MAPDDFTFAIASDTGLDGTGALTLALATIAGGSANDTLTGSAAADTLWGFAGDDRLSGGGGGDLLIGGMGADRLFGESGDDLLMAGQGLAVGPGAAIVKPAGFANNSLAGPLWVDGAFNLRANGDIQDAGTRPHVTIEGTGDGSADYYAFTVTVAGSTATFDIDGGYPSFDAWLYLFAASGETLAFNDDAVTDPGSVEYFPNFTLDSFITYTFAATGTYFIAVGAYPELDPVPAGATYSLHISLEDPLEIAAVSNDYLNGGSGADTLIGGDGDDTLRGEGGKDTLAGGYGDNSLSGGGGGDRLSGRSGNDILRGGNGWDRLRGNNGDDSLYGGGGKDRLFGGGSSDTLFGGGGNDSLNGGKGADRMAGGGGSDSFVFATTADSRPGSQRDRITDFTQGADTIDLAGIDAVAGGGDDVFTFIGNGAFSGDAGQLRQSHTALATIIAGDVDGDKHADFQIALVGNYTLTEGDFVL